MTFRFLALSAGFTVLIGNGTALAQDAFTALPSLPTGYTTSNGGTALTSYDVAGEILDHFSLSANLSELYDSNVKQGNQNIVGEDDEFITSLGITAGYRTKGSDWFLSTNYNGGYSSYYNYSELNDYNQSFSGSLGYSGPKLSASWATSYIQNNGANRYYGDFVKTTNLSNSITAAYALGAKTSLSGNISYSTTSSDGDFGDTASLDMGLFAIWKYSSLTQFGPGIRYTLRSGDNQGDRTSIGPALTANYRLSTKVALSSRMGLDFPEYEDGGQADPGVSTSLGIDYKGSSLWGMNLALVRDIQADPANAGIYNEITSMRLAYNRKIGSRMAWTTATSYEFNKREETDTSTNSGSDREFFSIDSTFGMPVLARRAYFTATARYRQQTSENSSQNFDGFQLGFSLSRNF